MQQLLKFFPDILMRFDRDFRHVFVNAVMARLVNLTP